MHLEPWQWSLALVCAFLNGVAKTGVPGLGILPVVMMFWVIPDARLASGAVLPMLCLADLFAVRFYHHHAQWHQIARLSPWVGVGLFCGCLTMWLIPDDHVLNRLMGIVILTMIFLQGIRQWRGDQALTPRWWLAAFFGVVAGFSTTVANAAGPVMSLYLLSMALPKNQFMGTGAWFFCIINMVKIPLFFIPDQHGQSRITVDTLWLDILIAPAVVVGAFIGRRIFTHFKQKTFIWVVVCLAGMGTLKLLFFAPHTVVTDHPSVMPSTSEQATPLR